MGTVDALTDYENEHIGERQPLPKRYLGLSVEEMDRRIAAARAWRRAPFRQRKRLGARRFRHESAGAGVASPWSGPPAPGLP